MSPAASHGRGKSALLTIRRGDTITAVHDPQLASQWIEHISAATQPTSSVGSAAQKSFDADIMQRLTVVEASIRLQSALGASHLQQVEQAPASFGLPAAARTPVRALRKRRNQALHHMALSSASTAPSSPSPAPAPSSASTPAPAQVETPAPARSPTKDSYVHHTPPVVREPVSPDGARPGQVVKLPTPQDNPTPARTPARTTAPSPAPTPITKAEEEVLDDIPIDEMEADPFFSAKVAIDGIIGHVHYIERDSVSKERLYLVRYHDGDYQHLTLSEVKQNLIDKVPSKATTKEVHALDADRAQLDEFLEATAAALRRAGVDDSCCNALVSRNRVS